MFGIAVFRIRLYLSGNLYARLITDTNAACRFPPLRAQLRRKLAQRLQSSVQWWQSIWYILERSRARSGRLLTGRTVQRSVKIYSAPGDATPAGYAPLDRYGLTLWLLLSMAVSGWLTVCGRVALGFASRML